jgi:hypothetical protein
MFIFKQIHKTLSFIYLYYYTANSNACLLNYIRSRTARRNESNRTIGAAPTTPMECNGIVGCDEIVGCNGIGLGCVGGLGGVGMGPQLVGMPLVGTNIIALVIVLVIALVIVLVIALVIVLVIALVIALVVALVVALVIGLVILLVEVPEHIAFRNSGCERRCMRRRQRPGAVGSIVVHISQPRGNRVRAHIELDTVDNMSVCSSLHA